MTSAGSSHLSLAIVQSQSPQNDKATTKAYPIPARRTQKFRWRSNDTLNSIEEFQSLPASTKAPVPILKRPLGLQYSNPELSRQMKPPRPPPPVRQAPPKTYTQPDVHVPKGMSDKLVSRTPVVIDSRARRQRHSELPLPKRPPLPYETVVPQSPPQHQGSGTDGDGDVHVGIEMQETRNVVATPADYEVIVPASSRNILISGTKSKLSLRGNENGMLIDISFVWGTTVSSGECIHNNDGLPTTVRGVGRQFSGCPETTQKGEGLLKRLL